MQLSLWISSNSQPNYIIFHWAGHSTWLQGLCNSFCCLPAAKPRLDSITCHSLQQQVCSRRHQYSKSVLDAINRASLSRRQQSKTINNNLFVFLSEHPQLIAELIRGQHGAQGNQLYIATRIEVEKKPYCDWELAIKHFINSSIQDQPPQYAHTVVVYNDVSCLPWPDETKSCGCKFEVDTVTKQLLTTILQTHLWPCLDGHVVLQRKKNDTQRSENY